MLTLKSSRSAWALALVVLCGTVSAQTSQSSSLAESVHALDSHRSNDLNTPTLQSRHPRYQVMPSDVLAISFPLSPELNVTAATVQPDGYLTLPNVGTLYVQGDTVPQIVDLLTKAYGKILHDPIITVDLTNFQLPQFTVSGQVGKPGQYPLRIDTTVSEAVAVAGGFLPTAKTQVFFFHRVSPDLVEVKKLNIKDLLNGKNVNEDVHLQPGDMVFVPEKFISNFRKYVPYGTGMFFNPSSALF
jgi:polysaccharide export outer membrane protein